jgi:hypothetical protein
VLPDDEEALSVELVELVDAVVAFVALVPLADETAPLSLVSVGATPFCCEAA